MRRRKICVPAMALVSSLLLTACGSKEYLKDIKAEKYVTLGNYMGLEAVVEKMEVPDGAVESFIEDSFLASRAERVPVSGRPVQDGDTVNIDFTGYQDGVAFEGGTGENFELTIGSGQFIDGFESGLIGAEEGEQVSLDLSFPDPYSRNPDLSGAPVVFEVTVNSITFKKVPEEMVERFTKSVENTMNARAASVGMTLAQYMQEYQNLDEAGFRAAFQENGERMAKQYIMYQAIADREGLAPTEEEIAGEISALMEVYGYASEEELRKSVDMEAFREDMMRKKVVAFLIENGNIHENRG